MLMKGTKKRNELLEALEGETARWVAEGIIEPAQRERILLRYSSLMEAQERGGPGQLVTTISIMGSVLVGVGIVLFVASNWSLIPKGLKLAIVLFAMLASYGAGYYLRYERGNYPKVGASLILLGALIFGAGMFLVAQIYHISAHYPNGPLLWGLVILPLAYLLRLQALMALAIVDLLIWLALEAHWHLPPHGLFSYLALTPLFLTAGVVLWGLGLMHREYPPLRGIGGPYVAIGCLVTLATGFILTFDPLRLAPRFGVVYSFCLGATVLFIPSVVARLLLKERQRWSGAECLGLFLIVVVVLMSYRRGYYPPLRENSKLIFNLLFALEIVGVVALGYVRRYAVYVNLGLLFFGLFLLARYFDLFWDLLPRSFFFIVGGLLLLLGGIFLERHRRRILSKLALQEARE